MVHIASFSGLILAALAIAPMAQAGPACARRNEGSADCLSRCASKWGWSGRVMGDDPWGQVMTRTITDMGSVLTKACRVRPSSSISGSSSTAPAAVPTVQNVGDQVSTSSAITVSSAPSVAVSSPIPTTSLTVTLPTPSSIITISSEIPSSSSQITTSAPSEAPAPPPAPATTESPDTTAAPPATSIVSVAPPSSSPKPPPAVTTQPATTEAPAPPPPSPSPTTSSQSETTAQASSGGTSASDIDQYLTAHNTVRAQHGAVALQWSDELASKAQQWANGCVFEHSGGTLGPFGENLAAGTGSSYDITAAVQSWTNEVSEYDPSNPQPSHFTQVVWKASTQVGCAEQNCSGIFPASFGLAKYFVCEYSPQGNIIGEFAQNVQV